MSTLSANFASDKLAYLGSAEDFDNSLENYNDEIVEVGFWTLDLVLSKKLSKKLSLKLVGRNLLDAQIKQTQKGVENVFNDETSQIEKVETNYTVSSYRKGATVSFSVKYAF